MSRVECTACERGEPEKCTGWAVTPGGYWDRCRHSVNVHWSSDGSAVPGRHREAS